MTKSNKNYNWSVFDMTVSTPTIEISPATAPAQLADIRALFLEYAQSLAFSLCFKSFDKELAELPGQYAPPAGALLLATVNGHAAGCCCLQRLDQNNCEMKRLYVRPHFRGLGVGHRLTKQIIAEASMLGYDQMLLETITEKMDEAIHLYRQLGFNEIAPYHANTIPSALYMELPLRRPSPDRK